MKSKVSRILLAAIVLWCAPFERITLASQKEADAVTHARKLIEELRKVADIPGIGVAVGIHNKVVWEDGFGFSDLENNVQVNPKTRFRLGSVSKMMTIAAAMRLVERGALDLDAPVSKYLPDIPQQYGMVTVRQLAGHLAGVRHYKPEDFQHDVKHFDSVKDSLKIFTGDPVLQEPMTKYVYSTFGYVLISAVLEAASGKEFLQLLDQEVFEPLQLRHSGPDLFREIIPGKTRYYERSNGKIRNAGYEDPSYKWAAAGIVASAGDLARFGMAHLGTGYLQKATLDQVFTSQRTSDGKETGVGVGWRIGSDWNGRKIYHHAGNIGGGRAVVVLYPQNDLVIALATNLSSTPGFAESTAQLIAEGFLDESRALDAVPKNLSGVYELSGVSQEKPYKARLELQRASDNYAGSITGGFPLLEAATKNGLPSNIQISSVWMKEKKPVFILVTPFGAVEMVLQEKGNGFQYFVEEGPAKFEGEMNKM